MNVTLDKEIIEIIPNFKIGCIFYKNITVGSSPQMIKGRIQLYQESLAFDLDEKPITEFKGITEWRSIFKKLGMDPSKYRPSHESLLRQIAKRRFIHSVNSAADINNFFSIQYGLPIGIYDTDNIKGEPIIALGEVNESYEGLNNREINGKGKLISRDALGPFGSPYVDSKRTAVTNTTRNALQIVYLNASIDFQDANELLHAMSKMFIQVNGGIADCFIKQ